MRGCARLLAIMTITRLGLGSIAPASAAVKVALEPEGVCFHGADGRLVLSYPAIVDVAGKTTRPGRATVNQTGAAMAYPGGGRVQVTRDGEAITAHFTELPARAKGLRMDMTLPIAFADGGKWRIGDEEPHPFPARFAGTQHLFKGNPKPVRFIGPSGESFTLSMPHGWQQLQDNHAWNTRNFAYMLSAQLPHDRGHGAYYTFEVATRDGVSAAARTRRAAAGPKVSLGLRLTDDGLAMDAGGLGQFTLAYPILVGQRWDQVRKPIERRVDGSTATVRFDTGASIAVTLDAARGELTLVPTALPADAKSLRMEMLIDFSYANGGSWKIGDGAETPFPAEKPAKPHLYQGNADRLVLRDSQGASLAIGLPPYSYQQLTDNREWGWKTFHWQFNVPNPGAGPMTVKIAVGQAPAGPRITVDRFGQSVKARFAEKVKSDEDLKRDIEAEAQYLAGLHPPARDLFGGLPISREELGLKRTGFFHVEKKGARWILVDPQGNAYFHLGVCGFNPSDDYTLARGREHIYEWLPPRKGEFSSAWHPDNYWGSQAVSFHLANTIRKFGRPYARAGYTARMIERVRKWGFNSAGAFSSPDENTCRRMRFPYVASLPLSPWEGFAEIPGTHGAFDPFDDTIRARCDERLAARMAPRADDPLLIGYFLNNEPLYEDLPRAIPALDGKHACKRRLMQTLAAKYGTIDAFNVAWETSFASFAAAAERGLPVKTRDAAADVRDFVGQFLEAYFQLVAGTFRKYDKNHMLIGNRLQAGTINNEQLCRISGKYLDVVSFNYYTYYFDKDFLDRIYRWTGGRPMFLSEFYYSSPKDSGLPGGGKDVSSQLERGLAYRNYVEQAATLGYAVGIEWFTLVDQSLTGRYFERFNGENANTGLVAVTDRPWKTMLGEMMQTNYDIYQVFFGRRPAFALADPRFTSSGTGKKVAKISRATGPIALDGTSVHWPGTPAEIIPPSRLVQGTDAGGVEATFKLCWDDAKLYLLAYVADPTPMRNEHRGSSIWSGDAVELFVGHEKIGEPGPLLFSDRQVLLSAGPGGNRCEWHFVQASARPECSMAVLPDVDGKGYTLEAAIPFAALGFAAHEGQEIMFDLAVDDSADGTSRLRQLVWNGTARNSGDRGAWGRAVLAK
jgi:hypothetical protein